MPMRLVAEADLRVNMTEVGTAKLARAPFAPVEFGITEDYLDWNLFGINPSTGVLTKNAADTVDGGVYYVEITAKDAGDPVGDKMLVKVTVVDTAVPPGTIFQFR